MTKLSDLFDTKLMMQHINDGNLSMRLHNTNPWAILNYTAQAAYTKAWDEVTLQCRGLVYNTQTEKILSRPYPKFFNWNEEEAPKFDLSHDRVVVSDKLDGSLISVSLTSVAEFVVASRGSFYSEQAIRARQMLQYLRLRIPIRETNKTYLFEIIYPENRIVVDYGDISDLVYHGTVDNATGKITFYPPSGASSAGLFEYQTLSAALAAPPRKNAEGLVVRRLSDDAMVKIKQADYVQAHRIVTNLSDKALWEHMRDNRGNIDGLLEQIPDEWFDWLRSRADKFLDEYSDVADEAARLYDLYWRPANDSKKAFAAGVMQYVQPELRPILFAMWDNKDVDQYIWKMLKPKGGTTLE